MPLLHLSSAEWFALVDWLIVAFLLGCSIISYRSARNMRKMERRMFTMAAEMATDLLEIQQRKREQENGQ